MREPTERTRGRYPGLGQWIARTTSWTFAVLMIVTLSFSAHGQDPSIPHGDDVAGLVQDLQAGLDAKGGAEVDTLASHLQGLLDKADEGELEIPDDLRYQARLTIARYEVGRLSRKPEDTRGASDFLLDDYGDEADKVDEPEEPAPNPSAVRRRIQRGADNPDPTPTRRIVREEPPKAVDPPSKPEAKPDDPLVVAKAEPEPKSTETDDKARKEAAPGPKRAVVRKTIADGPFVFRWPVKKPRVTSRYGMRKHPTLKRRKMHKGTDFGGGRGTHVLATGPAKVLRAGRGSGGVGIQVVLEHPGGWVSRYFHLSKVDVKAGQTVKRGQLIGRIGSTGRSTGPHLHFQVEYRGHTVNPQKIIGKRSDKVRPKLP